MSTPTLFPLDEDQPPGAKRIRCASCFGGRRPLRSENGERVLSLDGPLCEHCHGTEFLGWSLP